MTESQQCRFLGNVKSTRRVKGLEDLVIRQCDLKNKGCVAKEDHLKRVPGADVVVCEGCKSFKPLADADLLWLTCPHRGEAVGKITAAGCGCDKAVYACTIKGKCLKKLPTARTKESFGVEMNGVTVCATECEEWKPASNESPSHG